MVLFEVVVTAVMGDDFFVLGVVVTGQYCLHLDGLLITSQREFLKQKNAFSPLTSKVNSLNKQTTLQADTFLERTSRSWPPPFYSRFYIILSLYKVLETPDLNVNFLPIPMQRCPS